MLLDLLDPVCGLASLAWDLGKRSRKDGGERLAEEDVVERVCDSAAEVPTCELQRLCDHVLEEEPTRKSPTIPHQSCYKMTDQSTRPWRQAANATQYRLGRHRAQFVRRYCCM